MRLLRASLLIKSQEAVVYRENVLINTLFGMIPLVISLYLWGAIFKMQGEDIAGYDLSQMITYFVLVFIVQRITSARDSAVNLSEYIRSGILNNYLLKPVSFIRLNVRLFFAEKGLFAANIALPFLMFVIVLRSYLFIRAQYAVLFFISVFLAMVLNFLIYIILGVLTVWLEEISALLDLWGNIVSFLSGAIFPLTLLPNGLFKIISVLPFKYIIFTPIDIYMGGLSGSRLMLAFAVQLGWIFLFALLLNRLWFQAQKKYSGYGA